MLLLAGRRAYSALTCTTCVACPTLSYAAGKITPAAPHLYRDTPQAIGNKQCRSTSHYPKCTPPPPVAARSGGLPWWTGLVFASVILLYVSMVTIPAYSLVVHATQPHGHHAMDDDIIKVGWSGVGWDTHVRVAHISMARSHALPAPLQAQEVSPAGRAVQHKMSFERNAEVAVLHPI